MIELLKWVAEVPGLQAVIGFFAGHFVTRFTMSADKKADVKQKNFENTQLLAKSKDERYAAYAEAIAKYCQSDKSTFDDFYQIASCGDRYFGQMILIAEAILADNINPASQDNLVELCGRCATTTIPAHFVTLKEISKKNSFHWQGEMRQSDYRPIFAVVEKFGYQPPPKN